MYYLLLLPTVVVCLFTYLCLRWNQTKNYWLKRGVPHLPPNPLLGSLNFIQNQNVGLWFRDMYKNFKTPYIGIWLVWKPAIIVNTPELARRILVKDSAIFRDRNARSGNTDPIGSFNLFTVKDPVWTNIRRKLTSLFTSAKLRAFHDYINLKSNELLQRIERDRQKELELKKLYVDFTTDIIGTFSFGIESNATLTSKGPLRDVTNEFMRFSVYRGLCWFSIFFCSELVDVFRFTFFPKPSIDYFTRIFKTVTAQRKNNVNGKESRDVVDYLLDIQNESKKNNEEISDEFLISQAAILLLGGFDTTGSFLTYLTYELAFESECQEKLYQELKAAEEKAGGQLDVESVSDLPYLNCVVKECLRKYPIMGWLDRVASQDYQIDDKLTVKAGSVVYVNAIGMQYDPQYFPEPEKFNPDRFLPENEENIKPYTFLPFGDGPRICIGQRFFYLVGRIAASLLFLKYKVRPLPNMPRPNDVKIDNRGLLLHPGEPLFVEFVPRAENVLLKS